MRNPEKQRDIALPEGMLTTDISDILSDPAVNIVVELIGGQQPAYTYIREALASGRQVVTANKAVLATHGPELFSLAHEQGVHLLYEAAVCAGIPIIKALRESLQANRIHSLMGIINGTTNYILTKMTQESEEFAKALAKAQEEGFAESDPSADIEGIDAAHKLAILASLAFETPVRLDDVYTEGITGITPYDIAVAQDLGYVVKLLAIAKERGEGIEARVHPTFIPQSHPLAAVNDVFNAVFVQGDAVGDLMFYGRGAGEMPTASAVVADIIDAAIMVSQGKAARTQGSIARQGSKTLLPISQTTSKFYIRMLVIDRPGVLAQIADAFGRQNVSLESVVQKGRHQDPVDLVFVTHHVREKDLRSALQVIGTLDVVRKVANVVRVEENSI